MAIIAQKDEEEIMTTFQNEATETPSRVYEILYYVTGLNYPSLLLSFLTSSLHSLSFLLESRLTTLSQIFYGEHCSAIDSEGQSTMPSAQHNQYHLELYLQHLTISVRHITRDKFAKLSKSSGKTGGIIAGGT